MTAPVPVRTADPSSAGRTADLDIVIVSYHSRDLVVRCLDSLEAAAPGLDVAVTVVDNHSGDGTLEALADRGDVLAFDMGWNSGFARANNRAISMGAARYVLILNPDTRVMPGALATLVAFADEHQEVGVVAPRLLNADGSPQLTARRFPTPSAALFGRRSPLSRWFPGNRWSRSFLLERGHDGDEPFEVDWVSGAAMLVRRSVVESVGGFDEDFFLYWEDADWCRRISAAGHGVWCVPSATVVHDEGGSRDHGWKPRSIIRFHRGAYVYWTKHHARHRLNPARWAGALLLAARATTLIVIHGVVRPALSRRST